MWLGADRTSECQSRESAPAARNCCRSSAFPDGGAVELFPRWGPAHRLGRGLHLYGIGLGRCWEPRLVGLPLTLALALGAFKVSALVLRRLPRSRLRFLALWYQQLLGGMADEARRRAGGASAAECGPPVGDAPAWR